MDVEQRTGGHLYNSELSPYINLPITSSTANMNQLANKKSNFPNQFESPRSSSDRLRNSSKLHNLTPTFDVLPKIEENKNSLLEDDYLTERDNIVPILTSCPSNILGNKQTDLSTSEAFCYKNFDQWSQMPIQVDSLLNNYIRSCHETDGSIVSFDSENLLTPVEVDYYTDNTSTTSSEWGDDACEFDKNESNKVNQMFEEIDWMLFNDQEGSTRSCDNTTNSFSDRKTTQSGLTHLRQECSEWTHQFPHFRLVGSQISVPQEQGFTFNESERPTSVTPKNSPRIILGDGPSTLDLMESRWMSSSIDMERLSLIGHSVKLKISKDDKLFGFDVVSLGSSQEEVFALDGDMVEIIAIDYKMEDDYHSDNQNKVRSKNSLFPQQQVYVPKTPNAVIKVAVLTAVFDNLWSHVIDCIVPLISMFFHSCSIKELNVEEPQEAIPSNNVISSDENGSSKSLIQLQNSINHLDNILKISSKTLQFREKSFLQSIPEQSPIPSDCIKSSFSLSFGASKQPIASYNQSKRLCKIGQTVDRSNTPAPLNESELHDKDVKRIFPHYQSYYVNSLTSSSGSPFQGLKGKALYQSHSPLPPITKFSMTGGSRPPDVPVDSAQNRNSQLQSCYSENHSIPSQVVMTADIANRRPCTSQTNRFDKVTFNRASTPSGHNRRPKLNVHGNNITMNSGTLKPYEELPYGHLSKPLKNKPYCKSYNNPFSTTSKRTKSVYNSVK